jgi:hypothetical protein
VLAGARPARTERAGPRRYALCLRIKSVRRSLTASRSFLSRRSLKLSGSRRLVSMEMASSRLRWICVSLYVAEDMMVSSVLLAFAKADDTSDGAAMRRSDCWRSSCLVMGARGLRDFLRCQQGNLRQRSAWESLYDNSGFRRRVKGGRVGFRRLGLDHVAVSGSDRGGRCAKMN